MNYTFRAAIVERLHGETHGPLTCPVYLKNLLWQCSAQRLLSPSQFFLLVASLSTHLYEAGHPIRSVPTRSTWDPHTLTVQLNMSYNTPHNEFHFLHFDHGLDMSIPRRIFQTWKTKNELSPQLDRWSNTFKSLNPTFKYDLWDDNDNRSLIATEFPWFLPIYDSYQFEICRVDAVRYFYLYTYGGVYADIDTECLRPLDGILGLADVVLGRMGNNPAFLHSIPNAIMASRPRQEFWLLVIALMQLLAREALRPEFLTGPVILKRAVDLYFNSYREDNDSVKVLIEQVGENLQDMQVPESCKTHLRVMDSSAFYPLDWNNPAHRQWRKRELNGDYLSDQIKRELCGRSWTVTYWQHSWE